jgi:hypothetical protein
MLNAYLAIHLALLFGASETTPILESRLLGTWEPSSKTYSPPHGGNTITYHADHTCTHRSYSNEGPGSAHGEWELRGRKLVTRFGDIVVSEIIRSVAADRFTTRSPDGTIWTYSRVKPER